MPLAMKVRFYFDYSDYSSYLMMHVLDELLGLPVQVEWIVVDAYSLRALSGITLDDNSAKLRCMRQEAERFCLFEGVDFVWREEKMHSGLALRCGLWMMQHGREHFEAYSREVLTALWCRGAEMDVSLLRDIVASLGFELEEILDEALAHTGFRFQDIVLQEALSDGVFDVATLVIGTAVFQRFDNREMLRRLAISEWLRGLPAERISHSFLGLLLDLNATERTRVIRDLSQTRSEKPAALLGADKQLAAIRHELNTPDDRWRLARNVVKSDLQVHFCAGQGDNKLLSAFAESIDNAVNICTDLGLAYPDIEAFSGLSRRRMGPRLFCALVKREGFQGVIVLRVDTRGDIRDEVFLSDAPDCLQSYWTTLRGWAIGAFAPKASRDMHMARLGAHRGANLLIRVGSGPMEAMSEAWGCVARTWVAEIGKSPSVIDAESRRCIVGQEADVRISPTYKHKNGDLWIPPASRTLLLCEKSLTFGELTEGADLELACRGDNLEVSTAMQKSELSSSRVSERIRIGKSLLQMIPLSGEQIYVVELISHKILESLNRSPREALPIIVNYWSELEFEWLEIMRPVLSSIVASFQIPIVLVVGNQVAEVWLPSSQGAAYRIEKDNDHYVIDIAEMLTAEESYEKMLDGLGINGNGFLERLGQIASVEGKT